MVELDETATQIVQQLLSLDLRTRERGLLALREATRDEWRIEFREYLWKAIEEEKSKDFQQELVKFAFDKMQTGSLRKMIRFIENDQLSAGSQNYLSSKYLAYEDPQVRQALIKSLQRDLKFIPQFVLRLLNRAETYDDTMSSDDHLVIDLLSKSIPLESRQEFLVRIMNWYFGGTQILLKKIHIWDLIREDTGLHLSFLRAFYHSPSQLTLKFVKPAYQPYLYPVQKNLITLPERQDPITSWISLSRPLAFLYEATSSTSTPIRQEAFRIISNLSILTAPSMTNPDYFNLYQIWDEIASSGSDHLVGHIEEIDAEWLAPIFPSLQGETSSSLSSVLQGINPHFLFYSVLAYLPRYFMIRELENPNSVDLNADVLNYLTQGKYWVEHLTDLTFQLVGPVSTWKSSLLSALNLKDSRNSQLRVSTSQFIYYLCDILDTEISFDPFWLKIEDQLTSLLSIQREDLPQNPIPDLQMMGDALSSIFQDLVDLSGTEESQIRTFLEEFIVLVSKHGRDLQRIMDELLRAKDILEAMERELIKLQDSLNHIQPLSYWYSMLSHHVLDHLKIISKFLTSSKQNIDGFFAKIGKLSESYRLLEKLIGDPKDFNLQDLSILSELENIGTSFSQQFQQVSIASSPFSSLSQSGTHTLQYTIYATLTHMKTDFVVVDPSNHKQSLLLELQNEFEAGTHNLEDTGSSLVRLQSMFGIDESPLDVTFLSFHEIVRHLTYLLQTSQSLDLDVFAELFTALQEDYQVSLLNVFISLTRFDLHHLTEEQHSSILEMFIRSTYVKVRTQTQLYLRQLDTKG